MIFNRPGRSWHEGWFARSGAQVSGGQCMAAGGHADLESSLPPEGCWGPLFPSCGSGSSWMRLIFPATEPLRGKGLSEEHTVAAGLPVGARSPASRASCLSHGPITGGSSSCVCRTLPSVSQSHVYPSPPPARTCQSQPF